mmetsp:Transcript_17146/g.36340  ORF Transcript_17146/g.36340 Transcript_17146/m.36340 type:complete len:376 (+) Transcript_17146:251-1378(+)
MGVALRFELRHLATLPRHRILEIMTAPTNLLLSPLQAPQARIAALCAEGRLVLVHRAHERIEVGPRPHECLGLLFQALHCGPCVLDACLVARSFEGGLAEGPLRLRECLLRRGVPLPLLLFDPGEVRRQAVEALAQGLYRAHLPLAEAPSKLRLARRQKLCCGHGLAHVLAQLPRCGYGAVVLTLASGEEGSRLLCLLLGLGYSPLNELLRLLLELFESLAEDVLPTLVHAALHILLVLPNTADEAPQLRHPHTAAFILPDLQLNALHCLIRCRDLLTQAFQLCGNLPGLPLSVLALSRDLRGLVEVGLGEIRLSAAFACDLRPIPLQILYVLQRLSVSCCTENIVEALFHRGRVLQRPRGLLLVAEYYIFQHRT